ncbi:MAG: hypothetical protein ACK5Y2_14290 [Bdellovibrionales bacterium]
MNRFIFKSMLLALALGLSSGCAILHQFQISSIDSKTVLNGQKFEIIVSETGVNLQEATDTAKLFTQSQKTQDQMQEIQNIIAMFQMGPRTGNMVFNEKYADSIMRAIQMKCPSGKISGLSSIREMAKYPVVSGEIVRITGYCGG